MIEETRNSGNVKIEGSDIRLQGSSIDDILPQFQQLSLCCHQCHSKATSFALENNTLFPLCDDCSLKDCIEQLKKKSKSENDGALENK